MDLIVTEPTMHQLQEIAEKGNLQISSDELLQYKDIIDQTIQTYKQLDLTDDAIFPLKYPRDPGYRPSKEDNQLNAWWYRTDIKGTDSGKLTGKRIAIKDSIMIAGVPMTCGSPLLEGYIPDEDATVVTRILDQGGHITGKSTCENLSSTANSCESVTGHVLNPYNNAHSSGGSSSGSAVLVAQGEVDMSIGGDQGGSIRIPSSCCGIVGLKPTHGLVPYTGAIPCEAMLDHLGPMTSSVKDCALLLEVIAGYDNGSDSRQRSDIHIPEYTKIIQDSVSGMKIAVLTEGFDKCDEDVVLVIKEAIKTFEKSCDLIIEDVSIPEHSNYHKVWTPLCTQSAYKTFQNASALHGVKCHQNVSYIDQIRHSLLTKPHMFNHAQKLEYLCGKYIEDNYGSRHIAKAINILPKIVKAFDDILDKYEVIIMPTLPYKAPKLPEKGTNLKDYVLSDCFGMTVNTRPYNMTGHPALTLNAGYSEGLPIGLQIVGKHWDEATVLKVAYAFEQHITINIKKE